MAASCPSKPFRRSRVGYAAIIVLIIAAGLFWRSGALPLSAPVSKYGGDALWAALIFVGFGAIFPNASTFSLSLAAIGYSFATEFLQLYQASWLDSIRNTRLGHLVLGSTFNWPDLVAYTIGVALATVAETCFATVRQRKSSAA